MLDFPQRVASILTKHATVGLQNSNVQVTIIGLPGVEKIFLLIDPYTMTLLFMSMEGQVRYVEFMMIDPPHFNEDPRFDSYIFLLGCRYRLHGLAFLGCNGLFSMPFSSLDQLGSGGGLWLSVGTLGHRLFHGINLFKSL